MLHLEAERVVQSGTGWSPVYADEERRLGVISIAFLLPNPDSAVVWRGPKKNGIPTLWFNFILSSVSNDLAVCE